MWESTLSVTHAFCLVVDDTYLLKVYGNNRYSRTSQSGS